MRKLLSKGSDVAIVMVLLLSDVAVLSAQSLPNLLKGSDISIQEKARVRALERS